MKNVVIVKLSIHSTFMYISLVIIHALVNVALVESKCIWESITYELFLLTLVFQSNFFAFNELY